MSSLPQASHDDYQLANDELAESCGPAPVSAVGAGVVGSNFLRHTAGGLSFRFGTFPEFKRSVCVTRGPRGGAEAWQGVMWARQQFQDIVQPAAGTHTLNSMIQYRSSHPVYIKECAGPNYTLS
jgi:hypothetical protein